MPTLLDEETMRFGAHFAARSKKLLAKREKLQDEMLGSWSRRMSVHQEETMAECVSEGLGSLLYLLDDDQLKETPQEEITPAELLNILHCTAARVFKHRKSQVFDWAMMGLGDMDQMVSKAVLSEQAARARGDTQEETPAEESQEDVQAHVSELESGELLGPNGVSSMEDIIQRMQLEAPNDLLQSMEELAAVLEPTPQQSDRARRAGDRDFGRNSQEAQEPGEEVETHPAEEVPAHSRPGTGAGPATPGATAVEARSNPLIAEALMEPVPMGPSGLETDPITPSRPSSRPASRPASRPLQPGGSSQVAEVTQEGDDAAMTHSSFMPELSTTEQHASRPATNQSGQPATQIGLHDTELPDDADNPPGSRPTTSQLHPAGRETTPRRTEVAQPMEGQLEQRRDAELLEHDGHPGVPVRTTDGPARLETRQATNDAGPQEIKEAVPHDLGRIEGPSEQKPQEALETEVLTPGLGPGAARSPSSGSRPASGAVAAAGKGRPGQPASEALDQSRESGDLRSLSPRADHLDADGKEAIGTMEALVASPDLRPDSVTSLRTVGAQEVPGAADAKPSAQSALASPALPEVASDDALATLHEDALLMLLHQTSPAGPQLPASNLPVESDHPTEGTQMHDPSTPASPKNRTEFTQADVVEAPRQPQHSAAEDAGDKKDHVGPGPTEPQAAEEENMDDLAALVSANFSRRLAENSAAPAAPAGPVVAADFSNVVKQAQHVQAMQSIRADLGMFASLGLSPKSATTSPKAKGRRRRPRAMTRLGKELDEEEEDPAEVEDASPKDETASAEGDDFRMKLEAILAKAVQAKAETDRAQEAKDLAKQIHETQVSDGDDIVKPEVLELQRALKLELETELKEVSQQMEAADGKEKVSKEDLQRRATALQEQLQVVGSISTLRGADRDHVFMMALKEMTGGEDAAVAFAQKALSRQNSETTAASRGRTAANVVEMRFPRQNSPASAQSPESPRSGEWSPSPRSPHSPRSPRARFAEELEEVVEEQEPQEEEASSDGAARSGQQMWKRGKFLMKFLAGLKTMVKPEETQPPAAENTESQEGKVAMKLRKPEAWGRAAPINEEDHQDMSLAGIATGPKRELQPGTSGSPRDRPAGPLLPVRRLSQEVANPESIVAVGQSLEANLSEEEEIDNDEEYLQQPGPAWVDSWLQSAEGTFLHGQRHHGHHQEFVAPSVPSSEQPTVSILSLQAEGSSQGPGHRGLKGFAPRRGAPRFVRDKAKKGGQGSKPEDYGFMDVNKPKTVSIREEPEVREHRELEPRSDAAASDDHAPADSGPVDPELEVLEPASNDDVHVDEVDELRRLGDATETGPEADEAREEAQKPPSELRREDSGSVLSRNVSKTAVGKMYRANSKGSKLDLLIRSRSFRSSTSLNPSEPGDDDNGEPGDDDNRESDDDDRNVEDLDAEAEEVQKSEEKRQMAVRRWKLGALAVQAVVRLRETIHSPPVPGVPGVPGSRRSSFNPPTMVPDAKPTADSVNLTPLPVAATAAAGIAEGGQLSPATPALPATPRRVSKVETTPTRQAAPPKLPQVPVSQAPVDDVTALLRRTSVTPRTKLPAGGAGGATARASVLQVNVPDSAVLTPRGPAQPTTAPAQSAAITPRLPPAPAPPKTAVRQNGLGDVTAKNSLDRGNNLILTAATIQAVRSLDAPYLGGFGKSEQRLLSAHTQSTQLSHDDSHLTLSKDSAYSSAGFSPYTSQTELHKMSATNLSYQSSVAKFSTGSREEEEPKEEVEATEVEKHLQLPAGALATLPLLDRRSFGVETALLTPTGKLLGSPGCWNPGLSKEVGEIHVAHAGHVLEMRSLPVLSGKIKGLKAKAKAVKGPKLVLNNLAKPKKKRQLVQATTPAAGDARSEPRRQPLYTKGVRL